MRGVDASRADFRGASLAGVAVHGAKFRRANCEEARMVGMWGGPGDEDYRPEAKADEDGTMPPMEPLDAAGEDAVKWAEEEARPVDTVKDGECELANKPHFYSLRMPDALSAFSVDGVDYLFAAEARTEAEARGEP